MSIEIGPITCMNCIFKDAGIALSDNYKMQESADTYDYNFCYFQIKLNQLSFLY